MHRFRYAPRRWETLAYAGTMAETVARSFAGKAALAGYLIAQGRAARRVVRRHDAALVHAHWWFPAGLGARRATRPFVVTMHGSDVRLAVDRTWAHPLFRSVLRRAGAVTVVSRWLAEQARLAVPGLKPIVSPMPVNTSLFVPPPQGHRAPDELLFVGRLNEQKGLRLLLDAFAMMRQPAQLNVVGAGPDAAVLRERAATLGVGNRVNWLGPLPQKSLVSLYQRASAVPVPSLDEGLGLVAVEAQLCETPVVGFDSGGLADVIAHGETGLLIAPGDVAALAGALDRVLTDSQLRRTLGSAGRTAAMAVFSPDAVASGYAAIYRRLAGHAAA